MYDLHRPGAVAADVAAPSKKALFQLLGQMAARAHGLDAHVVVDKLTERERMGTTGFGGGTAIPHGRLAEVTDIVGLFVRLAQPIDFAAVDNVPVDLVYVLLSPSDAGGEHLKALAGVSRLLRDRSSVAKLRDAQSDDALVALLAEEGRDAG